MTLSILARIHGWRFHHGLDMLAHAYAAAREQPEDNRRQAAKELRELQSVPGAKGEHPDAEGYSFHLSAVHDEAQEVLKLIRESFAISLFHYWEKQARGWVGEKYYNHNKMMSKLIAYGVAPESDALETLLLVANVAKHSAGGSALTLFEKRKDLFKDHAGALRIPPADGEPEAEFQPGYDDLLVSSELLDGFFAAVRKSGPVRGGQNL